MRSGWRKIVGSSLGGRACRWLEVWWDLRPARDLNERPQGVQIQFIVVVKDLDNWVRYKELNEGKGSLFEPQPNRRPNTHPAYSA